MFPGKLFSKESCKENTKDILCIGLIMFDLLIWMWILKDIVGVLLK